MGLIRSLSMIRSLMAGAGQVDLDEREDQRDFVQLIRTDRHARELARALVLRYATGGRARSESSALNRLSSEEVIQRLNDRLAELGLREMQSAR